MSWGLRATVILVGGLNLVLAIGSSTGLTNHEPGYRIGWVGGRVLFWPVIVLALFAIGRRFRRRRPQAIILLCVWSLSLLTYVAPSNRSVTPPSFSESPAQADFHAHNRGRAFQAQFPPAHLDIPPTTLRTRAASPSTVTPPPAPSAVTPPPAPSTDMSEPAPTSATPPAVTASEPEYDFSPGSDERLYHLIDSAQADRYHAIVAAYVAACRARPEDAVLAVERARFIAHFAEAEENAIESAEQDYAAARENLTTNFPHAPVAILFELEHTYGKGRIAKAKQHVLETTNWDAPDAAKFWLLQAQTYGEPQLTLHDAAKKSFELKPSAEAAIIVAESAHALNRDAEAVTAVSDDALFQSASQWMRVRRMQLLFTLHQTAAALREYDYVHQHVPGAGKTYDIATDLARAGRIADARKIVQALGSAPRANARRQFEFELEFGSKAEAVSAYRALRTSGAATDPLLRQRARLFKRFPTAPLNGWDILGLIIIAGLGAAILLVSFVVLLPIHYWSLLRRSRAVLTSWTVSPWDLGYAGFLLASILWVAMAAAWYYDISHAAPVLPGNTAPAAQSTFEVSMMLWIWGLVTVLLLISLTRRRAWALFGGGDWGWAKCLKVGALCGLAGVFISGVYARIFGLAPNPSALTPSQLTVFKSVYAHVGGCGLLALAAVFIPVWEELVLRGVVLGALAKHIPWLAANTLQALVFASLHDSLALFPLFFALGYVCGELVRRSRSLLPGIALHVTNNIVVVAVILGLNSHTHLLG